MRIEGLSATSGLVSDAVRPDASAPRLSPTQPAAIPEPQKPEAPRPEEEQVRRAVAESKDTTPVPASKSRIRVDDASNRLIAQVVNENNEVIKQYPPEEILRFTARFKKLQGLLFDEKV